MEQILVIDDDDSVSGFMDKVLTHSGYQVIVARDGEEGIDILKNVHNCRLVITDIRMPRKDGNSVAKYVKSSAIRNDTHMVAITGFVDDVERDLFDVVLEKPFKVKDILNVIKFFQ
jgi:CheY-like chemotaxis protein